MAGLLSTPAAVFEAAVCIGKAKRSFVWEWCRLRSGLTRLCSQIRSSAQHRRNRPSQRLRRGTHRVRGIRRSDFGIGRRSHRSEPRPAALKMLLSKAMRGYMTDDNERKPETLEEQCKRLGIKEAPPDDPIYQQGWTISFVPRSKQNPRPAPQESQPAEKSDDPKGGTKPL